MHLAHAVCTTSLKGIFWLFVLCSQLQHSGRQAACRLRDLKKVFIEGVGTAGCHHSYKPASRCRRGYPLRSRVQTRRRHFDLHPRSPQMCLCDFARHLCNAHDRRIALFHKLIQSRQFVSRQSHRIPDHLLVDVAFQLEQNPAHGHPHRPVIETTLSLSHSLVVPRSIYTDIRGNAVVETVLHASEAFFDGFVGDFEGRRGDAAIVVLEADSIVAPDQRSAFCAAASGNFAASFARFCGFAAFGSKPVEGAGSCAEGAGMGLRLDAE